MLPLPLTKLNHSFEELYPNLYKVAYKLCGNRETAEDVVQETYLKARAGWPGFRGASGVYTWLYRITVNCSYQHISRLKKLPVQLISENSRVEERKVYTTLPRTNQVDEEILAAEMREKCLTGFIRCLPARQRIAFTLKILLELPSAQVAEIMETNTGNVKVLVHRARNHLQGLMENRCSLIKEKNPCQCEVWIAWALEKGVLKQESLKNRAPRKNHLPDFYNEMSQLHKILWLHKDSASGSAAEASLIASLKGIMKNKEIKILS